MKEKSIADAVLPVVVDTLPGREMKTSYIEKKIFNSPRTNKGLHMLSPSTVLNKQPLLNTERVS